jgi:transposase
MHKEAKEELRVRLKLVVLEFADQLGVTKACQEFSIPPASFYRWKQKYEKAGCSGLFRKRPVAYRHPHRTSPEVVEKILVLRTEHQMGALRIMYYLDRYHGIKISESTVSRVLKAHGLSRLPKSAPKRALHTQRYAKTVPGHHVQVDVKFLHLRTSRTKSRWVASKRSSAR